MFQIDTFDDAQLILPKKSSGSRFQQGNDLVSGGSERKRSLHIKKNIARKLDFGNDQDTLTAFPDISLSSTPSISVQTPSIKENARDFINLGYLNYESNNKSSSNLTFEAPALPLKSSLKKKKTSISQIEDENAFSNGSPLRPINPNVLNQQDNGIVHTKMTRFLQKSDRNTSNSNLSNLSFNSNNKRESNFERRQGPRNEVGVKIIRPPAQNNQNFDNSTKTIEFTENDTYFNNLIHKDQLIDFSNIDSEVENKSSITQPPKRRPLGPKVYDDEPPSRNKKDTSCFFTNPINNNGNDDDTNTNNLSSIILPKKNVKFGGKKNNIYDTNNSIDTIYITQNVSKQPMLANLDPDETNTIQIGNNFKNNVRFVNNNRNTDFKEKETPNFNHDNMDDEENDITKADIDPEFESEHSAILRPSEDHTIKFVGSNTNNNFSASGNNFIFTENANHSGILKNKNSSRSRIGSSFFQENGSFIGNTNNSRLGFDLGFDLSSDTSYIIENIDGLFLNQITALSKDIRQKVSNIEQRTKMVLNKSSVGNSPNILSIINENKEEVSKISSYFSICAANEILLDLAMLHENKQTLCRRMMQSSKTLKETISMAIEVLNKPKSTMEDVASAIARIEEKKNQSKKEVSEFAHKYDLLKKAIPFKVSSLKSNSTFSSLNSNQKPVLVKCTYRAVEQKVQLNNAELLHVKVSKHQRTRKLKNEMSYLMTIAPDFYFDGSKFSCLISSIDKRIRFAIFVNVPSFYPWCHLSVESIRVDFGVTFEEVKEKINSILSTLKITPHPLTDLVQALIDEYK